MRRFPPLAKDAAQVSVRYGVENSAVDLNEYHGQLAGAFVPLSDGHYRFHMNEHHGVGLYECCSLADGFFITFAEAEYYTPQSAYFRSPDSLHVYLACRGDGEYVADDGRPLSFEAPGTVLIVEPVGRPPAEITFAGSTRYIYIVMHREVLKSLYVGSAHELPRELQALLEGGLDQTVGRVLPLSSAMLRCLEDVHACSLEGRVRRLFLQSKALEIICLALEAFDQSECFQSTKHTARAVLKAQHLLEENFAAPPSLEKLAANVGLSRSTLCTGFRQILGQSVYEHIRDIRMRQALALLTEGDDPIVQVAYAVGYNRPSSFAVAVQRHFGATPTELRRRASLSSE